MMTVARPWEETWTVKDDPYGGYDCMNPAFVVMPIHTNSNTVSFEHWHPESRAESKALAEFVAAAPEMARALLDLCDESEDENIGSDFGGWIHRRRKAARAVLRKAGVLLPGEDKR